MTTLGASIITKPLPLTFMLCRSVLKLKHGLRLISRDTRPRLDDRYHLLDLNHLHVSRNAIGLVRNSTAQVTEAAIVEEVEVVSTQNCRIITNLVHLLAFLKINLKGWQWRLRTLLEEFWGLVT